jgi:hypothetical protein
VARLNPQSAWITREVPDLRIVDETLWAAAQARLTATRESPGVAKALATEFWKHRRARHLLTGLARCGVCGAPLAAVGRDYLACGAARRQGVCSDRRAIRRAVLENIILDALRSRLMQPDLVAEFAEAWQQEVNRRRAGADVARERTARELAQVERKLAGLIDAIANGLRAPSRQQALDGLERRRAKLAQRLPTAPTPLPRLHPNLAEVYRRKVTELGAVLRHPEGGGEALSILRGLVDRVTLTPADDQFQVEIEGALAGMLALAQGGAAAVSEVFRSSVRWLRGPATNDSCGLPRAEFQRLQHSCGKRSSGSACFSGLAEPITRRRGRRSLGRPPRPRARVRRGCGSASRSRGG